MIETRAPGKLYIAGEYAVVEPGGPAVLVAVDRFLTARLTPGVDAGRIHSSEYGQLPVVWTRDRDSVSIVQDHHPYDYVLSAIATVERLRAERGLPARYFDLEIGSDLDDTSGRKFGLGSSAAVVVAVIAAIDEFYGLDLDRMQRFRLAMLATIEVAPSASGGDLAASTFGGWIRYTSPDRAALREHLATHGVTATLSSETVWAQCSVTPLPRPSTLDLLVGWTGSPASTERLVDGVQQRRPRSGPDYGTFVRQSHETVDALVASLQADDGPGTLATVREARRLLQGLGAFSGISIETGTLAALCDIAERHGASAKPSGAGGGDCGIALTGPDSATSAILRDWESHDIRRLDVAVHPAEGESHDV